MDIVDIYEKFDQIGCLTFATIDKDTPQMRCVRRLLHDLPNECRWNRYWRPQELDRLVRLKSAGWVWAFSKNDKIIRN